MAVLKSTLKLSLLDDVSARARKISSTISSINAQATRSMSPLRGIGGQLLAFGGAYLGVREGMDATAGAAIRFEAAFADVRKVVDATDEQFANMQSTIRKMSTELPLASTDIAALFAAAGESGIAQKDLVTFAQMAARVGIAFDMSAGAAGESLAKLKTQLGLTVAETGDMADAINHLSNNMASKASDITAFMLRIGALSKMGGLAKEQVAALGSAMISAGAEPEIAATAMQNVVKAMTRGASAKKAQKGVAAALGLDLIQLSKDMQKDAPKAIKKVLAAIAKAPKDQHISLLSDFFGDEAKAFAPLVGNIGLIDEALGAVGDKAKYAGSAFREFVERSKTTENVLVLLKNKFMNVFEGIGAGMLPDIKEAALGIGTLLDTLGERATPLDQLSTAIQGFSQGLGLGGIRETIEAIGDLLLGPANGSTSADKLGLIFAKFKSWGADVREFNAALQDSAIGKFLGEMGGYGFKLLLASVAFGVLAGTVRKLASALMFLSGASTALSLVKTLAKVGGWVEAGVPGGGAPGSGTPAAAPKGTPGFWAALGKLGVYAAAAGGALTVAKEAYTGDTSYSQGKSIMPSPTDAAHGLITAVAAAQRQSQALPGVATQQSMDNANRSRAAGFGGSTDTMPGKTADDLGLKTVSIDASSIAAMIQPMGVQQVAVTNPQPVSVNVNNSFVINEAASAQATATAVAVQSGAAAKTAVESSFGGGGGF